MAFRQRLWKGLSGALESLLVSSKLSGYFLATARNNLPWSHLHHLARSCPGRHFTVSQVDRSQPRKLREDESISTDMLKPTAIRAHTHQQCGDDLGSTIDFSSSRVPEGMCEGRGLRKAPAFVFIVLNRSCQSCAK